MRGVGLLPRLPCGSSLRISQLDGVLGGTIWPSASVLCQHLLATEKVSGTSPSSSPPPISLELGSGTGIVGIYVASALHRKVVLTEHRPPVAAVLSSVAYNVDGTLDYDLLEGQLPRSDILLNLLQKNVNLNKHLFNKDTEIELSFDEEGDLNAFITTNATKQENYLRSLPPIPEIEELDWTISDHIDQVLEKYSTQNTYDNEGFELIFASDVTYISYLHKPLATTIARLLQYSSSLSKCIIAHQTRVCDFHGNDFQLHGFHDALKAENLSVLFRDPILIAPTNNEDNLQSTRSMIDFPNQEIIESLAKSVKILEISYVKDACREVYR